MSIDVSKGNKYVLVGLPPAVVVSKGNKYVLTSPPVFTAVSKGNKYVLLKATAPPVGGRRRQFFIIN